MNAIPIDWAGATRAAGTGTGMETGTAEFAGDDLAAGGRAGTIASTRFGRVVAARSAGIPAADATGSLAAAGAARSNRSGDVQIRGRRLGLGLIAAGCCVILWIGVLAAQTPVLAEPANWNAAWIGLDALEGVGLLTTGLLLRRQDQRMCLAAAATAMLLFVDAWFDVMTALPSERPLSIAMAVLVELPIGSLCAVLALRGMGTDWSRTG